MTPTLLTIFAKDVRPGDRIYNAYAYHQTAKWITVLSVEKPDNEGYVTIRTTIYTTALHAREGIAVQRSKP